jgi:hypothetical protein
MALAKATPARIDADSVQRELGEAADLTEPSIDGAASDSCARPSTNA